MPKSHYNNIAVDSSHGKAKQDMEAGNYMIARLIRNFGTKQQEEIAKEDEPPTTGMERFSLTKSMTL